MHEIFIDISLSVPKLQEYFFRGTLLILGAFMLHICFVGTLYRPIAHNFPRNKTRKHGKDQLGKDQLDKKIEKPKKPFIERLGFDCGLMKHIKVAFHYKPPFKI